MTAPHGYVETGLAWCKKLDMLPSRSLLLVSRSVSVSTESLLVALYAAIHHVTGVNRQEQHGETLLLLELARDVTEAVLPSRGEVRVSVEGSEILFTVHRLTRVVRPERVTVADLDARGLLPSSSETPQHNSTNGTTAVGTSHDVQQPTSVNETTAALKEALTKCKITGV